jgi:hypothetical protein
VTVEQANGQADPTNALPITFTVAFSEPVTGFDATDLARGGTSQGGTVTVSGSGATYTISVSGITTNGSLTFSIAAGKALDAAGNGNLASSSSDGSVTYDNVRPTVTVVQSAGQADPTKTLPISFTVTFSEPVTGFDVSDVVRSGTSTGGTLGVSGSGAGYVVTLTGAVSSGTVVVAIPAGGATDVAGNANLASTSVDNSVTYDVTPPTVVINAPANNATNVALRATFSGTGEFSTGASVVTVEVFRAGVSQRTTSAIVQSNGQWSVQLSNGQGSNGHLDPSTQYTVVATQTDALGNKGTSTTLTFTTAAS